MISKGKFWGSLTGLGLLLGMTLGVRAAEIPAQSSMPSEQFRRIEQPLALKVGITLGGLALIGLELWWFLLSKSQAQQALAHERNQVKEARSQENPAYQGTELEK